MLHTHLRNKTPYPLAVAEGLGTFHPLRLAIFPSNPIKSKDRKSHWAVCPQPSTSEI